MKYRDAARKLRRLGCVGIPRRSGGSHRKWRRNDRLATIPDWGPNDLKLGTLRAAVEQLGIEWEEFLDA